MTVKSVTVLSHLVGLPTLWQSDMSHKNSLRQCMSRDLLNSRRCQFTRCQCQGHEGGGHIHMFQHLKLSLKLSHITQPENGHTGLDDPLAAAATVQGS